MIYATIDYDFSYVTDSLRRNLVTDECESSLKVLLLNNRPSQASLGEKAMITLQA